MRFPLGKQGDSEQIILATVRVAVPKRGSGHLPEHNSDHGSDPVTVRHDRFLKYTAFSRVIVADTFFPNGLPLKGQVNRPAAIPGVGGLECPTKGKFRDSPKAKRGLLVLE